MDEQRLAEIEHMLSLSQPMAAFIAEVDGDLTELIPELKRLDEIERVVPALIAEVRRLRRENHLLNLSRGTPSMVGGD